MGVRAAATEAPRPRVVRAVRAMQAWADETRRRGERIGFVPTMGALHEGHLALVRRARELADRVVVSIFVNPTQFGPGEDFERYPRDFEGDLAKLAPLAVDVVFAPPAEEIYPPGDATWVVVERLTEPLCGRFRPGHFRGVTTVVARLFLATKPHVAVFGEKDYQQLQVVRRMVRDLHFDVEIVGVPTVREPDGLAMSSRNAYLAPDERARARAIPRALAAARAAFEAGERDARALERAAREVLEATPGIAVEYAEVRDAETLEAVERVENRAVLAIAARVGAARLIDNVVLEESRC